MASGAKFQGMFGKGLLFYLFGLTIYATISVEM